MRLRTPSPGRMEALVLVIVVLLVGAIAYAPSIGKLGFYRDDWYQLWALDTFGPSSIIALFSIDRPAMGYLYAGTSALLGLRPLPWHLYALGLRLAGALAFLGLVRSLWPRQTQPALAATLLYLVYPGFLHQPNADTFSNHLYTYSVATFSLWLTALSQQAPSPRGRRIATLGAVITAIAYFPIYEYMIGLEVLRAGILWVHQRRQGHTRPRRAAGQLLAAWAPYAFIIALFLFWRVALFTSQRGATNVQALAQSYTTNPRHALARLLLETPKDVFEAVLGGWIVPTYDSLVSADYRDTLTAAAWGVLAAAAAAAVTARMRTRGADSAADAGGDRFAREALLLGALGTLGPVLVVVAAGRDIRWDSGFDRYTLQCTAGIALLTVGFLWGCIRHPVRSWIPVFLVGVSVLTHALNTVEWRTFWLHQQRFWWQMVWRAPQIRQGTVLVIEVPGGVFREDYEIWGPANLIYDRGNPQPGVAAEILNMGTVSQIQFGERSVRGMRVLITIEKDFNRTLVASMPSPASCLHLLDGTSPEVPTGASPLTRLIAPYSRIDQVLTHAVPASPPPEIFGPEPEHTWCFYYERADLARQRGDWEDAARLGREAQQAGLAPSDRTEWMPFLMAYIMTGDERSAAEVAQRIRGEERVRHALCDSVDRTVFPDPALAATFDRLLCEFE